MNNLLFKIKHSFLNNLLTLKNITVKGRDIHHPKKSQKIEVSYKRMDIKGSKILKYLFLILNKAI